MPEGNPQQRCHSPGSEIRDGETKVPRIRPINPHRGFAEKMESVRIERDAGIASTPKRRARLPLRTEGWVSKFLGTSISTDSR
jgi:hypothetical protein